MTEEYQNQINDAIKRCPIPIFPYEIAIDAKEYFNYDIVCAIPVGKKVMIWMTYIDEKDVAILLDLNNEKKIIHSQIISSNIPFQFAYGTLLYGTILSPPNETTIYSNQIVVIEDLLYYKGLAMQPLTPKDKMKYLLAFFKELHHSQSTTFYLQQLPLHIAIINCWNLNKQQLLPNYANIYNDFHSKFKSKIVYEIHHLQIRKLDAKMPYYNLPLDTIDFKLNLCCKILPSTFETYKMDTQLTQKFIVKKRTPQFSLKTNFILKNTNEQDYYLLYIYGKNKKLIYFDTLGIQTIEQSKLVGSCFYHYYASHLQRICSTLNDEDLMEKNRKKNETIVVQCIFDNNIEKWLPVSVFDCNTSPKPIIAHYSQFC
jgi:hypothetical protein